MPEKPLDPPPAAASARVELVAEWTRVEQVKRERIRLRWPRLAELLDTLAAAS